MFKRVERRQAHDLVLLSGWGFDYRVFCELDLPYNYVHFVGPSVEAFAAGLRTWMGARKMETCFIMGWSLGAFVASAFAARFPGAVAHLFLLGARRAYPPDALARIKVGLQRNKRAALLRLYRASFRGHDPALYRRFKETLMEDYMASMSVAGLCADLDWLARARAEGRELADVRKVTLVHGVQDQVAPLGEAEALARSCPQARCLWLDPCGHLPFLHPEFSSRLP